LQYEFDLWRWEKGTAFGRPKRGAWEAKEAFAGRIYALLKLGKTVRGLA